MIADTIYESNLAARSPANGSHWSIQWSGTSEEKVNIANYSYNFCLSQDIDIVTISDYYKKLQMNQEVLILVSNRKGSCDVVGIRNNLFRE